MHNLTIIKVGGKIVEEKKSLNQLLESLKNLDGYKLLVHGGGRNATKLSEKLGIETKMFNGRRITDLQTLDIAVMVYAGLVNKNIVASLQSKNINAIGLCGADMKIILSEKRPIVNGVDFGYVGDVKKVDGENLSTLINSGVLPVLAPITFDENGQLLNTNADTIASSVAIELAKYFNVRLIYCFEKKGVLENENDENSVIPLINNEIFNELKNKGAVSGGMIPKLENALLTVSKGVDSVVITSADNLQAGMGTEVKN